MDCERLREPLSVEHHAVDDVWIRSLAYNRVTQCLEVRFTWNAVTPFRPVPLSTVREIWKARPINVALDKLVIKNRRIRFDEVRTEGKLLVSLLAGWRLLQPTAAEALRSIKMPGI